METTVRGIVNWLSQIAIKKTKNKKTNGKQSASRANRLLMDATSKHDERCCCLRTSTPAFPVPRHARVAKINQPPTATNGNRKARIKKGDQRELQLKYPTQLCSSQRQTGKKEKEKNIYIYKTNNQTTEQHT